MAVAGFAQGGVFDVKRGLRYGGQPATGGEEFSLTGDPAAQRLRRVRARSDILREAIGEASSDVCFEANAQGISLYERPRSLEVACVRRKVRDARPPQKLLGPNDVFCSGVSCRGSGVVRGQRLVL